VRQYCLTYGASMMFTDIHQLTNIELLYRYLLHRLYDFEFKDLFILTSLSQIPMSEERADFLDCFKKPFNS
jgi:hypothetical protein